MKPLIHYFLGGLLYVAAACSFAACDDEETYSRYAGGAKRRYEETFTKKQMIESCVKMYFDL